MMIQDGDHGSDQALLFSDSAPMFPVHIAGYVDVDNCASSTSIPPDNGSSSSSSTDTPGTDVDVDLTPDAEDTTSTDSCGGSTADSGGCDGSGDTGSGSCSGDSSGGGCSGGDVGDLNFNCSVIPRRAPRLSPLLMAALAMLAPLRRRGRSCSSRR
jgi:hypothetical protein